MRERGSERERELERVGVRERERKKCVKGLTSFRLNYFFSCLDRPFDENSMREREREQGRERE